ncbi:MAG: hypothetical protein IJS58_08750 [Bacilli bacterium]|nr:hypothetical protein [Bacilli bacterium]
METELKDTYKGYVLHSLSNSQKVVKLQCDYSLDKRVINILSAYEAKEMIDYDLFFSALKLWVNRNDCLRIRFVKRKRELKSYFLEKIDEEELIKYVDVLEFDNDNEYNKWIDDFKKKPIKYMKGEVFNVHYVKINNKLLNNRLFFVFKFCHMIIDIMGLVNIYNDLSNIIDHLKNNNINELKPTYQYEPIVIRDNQRQSDELKNYEDDKKFFYDFLSSVKEPNYAPLSGYKIIEKSKEYKKGKKYRTMALIRNDTIPIVLKIDNCHVKKMVDFCTYNHYSLSSVLLYLMAYVSSLRNNRVEEVMPIELCNCRGMIDEKKCGGTKAQSLAAYTKIDYNKSIKDNIDEFILLHQELFRHVSFDDCTFEKIIHKVFKSSLIGTYYNFSFSFIPVNENDKYKLHLYSNGKCALIVYSCAMFDYQKNEIEMIYDYQYRVENEEGIRAFHEDLIKAIDLLDEDKMNIILNNIY